MPCSMRRARRSATGCCRREKSDCSTVEPRGGGPYVLVLNSGPASSTVSELAVLDSPWAIDTRQKLPYRDGPMHYHFLRDLKLGGFNLAMVDVEYAPQEFLSDEGLRKWTALVRGWGEAARRYQLRMLYAIDLGGTAAEVESWGDSPKGLYVEDVHDKAHFQAGVPLAPCPLQKIYWERILLRRGREIARMACDNPYVVGIGIDPETYACHVYGHYKPGGTCYCDYCLGGFLRKQKLPESTLKDLATGQDRLQWLVKQKLTPQYDAYLEDEMRQVAVWCREELHRVNPDLLLCVYVLEIGNWFCRGLAEGLSTPDLPVINFCEHTYYGVGYDRPWLDKTMGRFKDLGANFLQGSALWDLYFPPTKPGYMAAHAYNLAVRAEGWWYWPGDRLYDDWRSILAYDGQPARKADSWHAAVLAHAEIDRTMQQPGRTSPLDTAEKVAWKGKYRESEGGWAADSGVAPRKEPQVRLRLAQPARLYFVLPQRAQTIDVTGFAPGDDNGADIVVLDSSGKPAGQLSLKADQPETLIAPAGAGIWTLDVKSRPGVGFRDVGLALKPAALISTSKESLLVSPVKQPGLVGYWSMDEGRGETVADTSQKVAYHGVLRGGQWTPGVEGLGTGLRRPQRRRVRSRRRESPRPHPVHPLGLGPPRCAAHARQRGDVDQQRARGPGAALLVVDRLSARPSADSGVGQSAAPIRPEPEQSGFEVGGGPLVPRGRGLPERWQAEHGHALSRRPGVGHADGRRAVPQRRPRPAVGRLRRPAFPERSAGRSEDLGPPTHRRRDQQALEIRLRGA